MLDRLHRHCPAGLIALCALSVLSARPGVAADVPDALWDPSASYYAGTVSGGVPLTGVALRTQLYTILKSDSTDKSGVNVTVKSIDYDLEKQSMPITDRVYNPLNPTGTAGSKMWGVYDRAQLGAYGSTPAWNREHVWPDSKLGSNSDQDMFGLRPALVASNGDRANYGYGGIIGRSYTGTIKENGVTVTRTVTITASTPAGNLPKPVTTPATTFPLFYAGPYDRGDVARACFYMATRYYIPGNPNSVNSLKIVNATDGYNPDGTMGDLESMLHWHYDDPVDNFERRRNQLIYLNTEQSKTTQGSLSQGNRNPYVDHPEYVWAVFGDGANDSTISVAAATAGASSKAVNFGRVIVGGTAPTLSTTVAVNKIGADPTTFNVTASGAATTNMAGNLNTFDYAAQSKTMTVGLTGVTTTASGLKSGSVLIDNTDITTGGAGTGKADGNDTIDLSLAVLDHSNASFDATADVNTLNINFGLLNKGQTAAAMFSLRNLLSASGYTAGLDLDSITATGDTGAFATSMAAFAALAGGTGVDYLATFTPTRSGNYYATYVLGVSDENLSGATAGTSLTLVLTGVAGSITRDVPEPTALAIAPLLGVALRRRRT